MMSGMRNPSPISMSSPRETSTSPPAASSFRARKTAAALLLTAIPGAPSSRSSSPAICVSRFPRRPASRSYSRLEYPPGIVKGASGARPRLVCSTTPVALMTRRREGHSRAASASPTRSSAASAPAFPARSSVRSPSRTRRASATTRVRGNLPDCRPSRSTTSCTAGSSRNFLVSLTISIVPRLCKGGATDYTRKFGAWLSLARAPGSGPGGRWFESTRPDHLSAVRQFRALRP